MKYRRVPAHSDVQWVKNMVAKGWGSGFATKRTQDNFCHRIIDEVMECAPVREGWHMITTQEINRLYFSKFSMNNLQDFARAIEALVHEKNR